MKRTSLIVCSLLIIVASGKLRAAEGMWLPTDIAKLPLAEEGCEMQAADIFSPDSASLSRAIIGLGSADNPFRFFCTASFISPQGLILTNYHCGTRMIQQHSTVGANIFQQGYWAASRAAELRNEGLTASVLMGMQECTDTVAKYTSIAAEDAVRSRILDSLATVYEKRAQLPKGDRISIKPFYDGNRYFALTYRRYTDVRLVGVPPRSIGKFGGDTDNWMWPRHTGDFCILRVYADSAGMPAPFDSLNVPLRPQRYLPLAKEKYAEGDFSFVMGFPGSTSRYMPADEVRVLTDVSYRERAKIRERILAKLDARMAADEDVYIKYFVRQQSVANYYKNFKGQVAAARIHHTVDRRYVQEDTLVAQMERLDDCVSFFPYQLRWLMDSVRGFRYADAYYREALGTASASMQAAGKMAAFFNLLKSDTATKGQIKAEASLQKGYVDEYYAHYDAPTDAGQLAAGLGIAMDELKGTFRPDYFAKIEFWSRGDAERFTKKAYRRSVFRSQESLDKFLAHPRAHRLKRDRIFKLSQSVAATQKRERARIATYSDQIRVSKHVYTGQKLRVYTTSGTLHYPDANSTLRFTYGHIGGYSPRDAVQYKYQTTARGVVDKYIPGDPDFDADSAFIAQLSQHPDMPVCLISDNDITGGNSGSPLMNARGELIGLAFDGNWEALSGDIEYLPKLQRCISVDMRYVLFVVENVGHSSYILQELGR